MVKIVVAIVFESVEDDNQKQSDPGSNSPRGVLISIFIFYFLALSLRNFTGFHCIVLMYVNIILLRNTTSRSNRKRVARAISQ